MAQEYTLSGLAKSGALMAIWCGMTSLAFEAFGRHPTAAILPIGGVLGCFAQLGFLFIYALCGEKAYVTLYAALLFALISTLCTANEIRWISTGLPEGLRGDSHAPMIAALAVPPLLLVAALVLAALGIRAAAQWRRNWKRSLAASNVTL
ncbi:hypothetical protein [Paraburkholderia youngii]|uniref:hypothetical protein n=1 Tax=Paraburkholderia youngii TaxID=2782701 RepID=UPI003D2023AA